MTYSEIGILPARCRQAFARNPPSLEGQPRDQGDKQPDKSSPGNGIMDNDNMTPDVMRPEHRPSRPHGSESSNPGGNSNHDNANDNNYSYDGGQSNMMGPKNHGDKGTDGSISASDTKAGNSKSDNNDSDDADNSSREIQAKISTVAYAVGVSLLLFLIGLL